jgi:CHAD domain-containing protein
MHAEQPLGEAAAVLVAERVKKASKKVAEAKKGDVDGVHDLRVAIRKIRAVLSVLREATSEADSLRKADKRLSRLFSALGDVRDHDVMVARVTDLAKRRKLQGKGLDVLIEELEARRKQARKSLRACMKDDDPDDLLDVVGRCVARLAAKMAPDDEDDHRALVRHFASSVILRRFETVLAFELELPASVDVLHRLRVAIKKLRYAVDFFSEALGETKAEAIDGPLQSAQDQLGDLHDHHVARALVTEIERRYGSKRGLGELRDADDAEAARLLEEFEHSWKVLSGGAFTSLLAGAVGALLGPKSARASTMALRRAETAH